MHQCEKCNSKSIEISKSNKYFDVFTCKICGYWTYKRISSCCRNPFEIVVIKHHTNTSFLYNQCINCGGSINRNKPLSHKKYSNMIRDEFNDARFEKWINEVKFERKQLSEMKKEYNFYNSKKYKYYIYLNSVKWKEIRKKVFDRDNNTCQICKKNPAIEVHHLTYDNIENEKMDDLISVCRDCHKKIHGINE